MAPAIPRRAIHNRRPAQGMASAAAPTLFVRHAHLPETHKITADEPSSRDLRDRGDRGTRTIDVCA
jgi:hypothetical protein